MNNILEKEIDQAVEQGFLLTMEEDLRLLKGGIVLEKRESLKPELLISFEKREEAVRGGAPVDLPIEQETEVEKETILQIKRKAIEEEGKERKVLVEQAEKEAQERKEQAEKEAQERKEQMVKREVEVEKETILQIKSKAIEEEEKERRVLVEQAEKEAQERKEQEQKEQTVRLAEEREKIVAVKEVEEVKEMEEVKEIEKEEKVALLEDNEKKIIQLKQRMVIIGRELKILDRQKQPFLERLDRAKKEIDSIVLKLNPLLQKEAIVEDQRQAVEEQEKQAVSDRQREKSERKRQKFEQSRRAIEREKWFWQIKQAQIKEGLYQAQNKLKEIAEEVVSLEKEKKAIENDLELFVLEKEKFGLLGKQIELEKQSVATINRLEVLDSKENEIVMKLNDVAMREDAAEKKVAEIISKENEAKNLGLKKSEERKISKERWRAEDQRAAVEKERWALQKESSDLARQIDSLRESKRLAREETAKIVARLDEIDILLENGIEEGRRILEARDLPVKEQEPKIIEPEIVEPEIVEPEIIELVKPAEEPVIVLEEPVKNLPDKKDERLRAVLEQDRVVDSSRKQKQTLEEKNIIEEIRRKAREQAQAERLEQVRRRAFLSGSKQSNGLNGAKAKEDILKKLSNITPQEEEERRRFLQRIESAVKFQPAVETEKSRVKSSTEIIFRPVVQKPALFEKLAMRIVVILSIAVVAVVGYFLFRFFNQRQANSFLPESLPVVEKQVNESLQTAIMSKEDLPAVPFVMVANQVFEFARGETIPSLLKEARITNFLEDGQFKQIGFLNQTTGRLIDWPDFFQAFGAKAPGEISSFLLDNPVMAIFYSDNGPQLTMIFQQRDSVKVKEIVLAWQAKIAEDLENLTFVFFDENNKPLQKNFAVIKWGGETIYCLPFSLQGRGICYAVFADYFVIGFSTQAMEKILENLI